MMWSAGLHTVPSVQALAARAAEAARHVYNDAHQHATAVASDYEQKAVDAVQGVQGKISDKLDELRGKASDLRDTARSNYGQWLNRKSLELGRDEDHHYIGQTACALGSLAIGASAVYLFDPDQGSQRRAQLIDRATYAVRETGDFFRKTGRRIVNSGRVAAGAVADRMHQTAADVHTAVDAAANTAIDAGVDTNRDTGTQSDASNKSFPVDESSPTSMGT